MNGKYLSRNTFLKPKLLLALGEFELVTPESNHVGVNTLNH